MSARPSSPPPPRPALPELEAVVVAMIVAPGVYARNRMFDFFESAAAQKARKRAATVRGIVPQLARATSVTLTPSGDDAWTLRYVVLAVSLTRVVELTSAELAALRTIAERAHVSVLPCEESDRDLVAKRLAKLMKPE
ncbi:MAG: hypothetical protein KIT84_28040 [Labilithrix sp.]|nr:hypothetical protein [Labilithrix sp.]MCW5814909.1 hypothetical protein [Labilithrix sp.]